MSTSIWRLEAVLNRYQKATEEGLRLGCRSGSLGGLALEAREMQKSQFDEVELVGGRQKSKGNRSVHYRASRISAFVPDKTVYMVFEPWCTDIDGKPGARNRLPR